MGVILDSCIWVALAAQTLEHQTVIVTPPPRMGESEHGSIGANKQPLLRVTKNMTTDSAPVRYISSGLIGDACRGKEAVRRRNEEALASWSDAVGGQAPSRSGVGRRGSATNRVHMEGAA
jgi:hypothetical protein